MNESETKPVSYYYDWSYPGDSGHSVNIINTFRSRSGSDNPGYKAAIAAGSCATTGFIASETKINPKGGVVNGVGGTVAKRLYYMSSGNYDSPDLPPSIAPNSQGLDRATENFVRKARSAISSTKGMTVLGELRETIGMLKHPVSTLRRHADDYLNAVKKTALKSKGISKRSLKHTLSDTWLEYSFGWTPLIHDVRDIMGTIKELGAKASFESVSSSGSVEAVSFSTGGGTFGNTQLLRLTTRRDTFSSKVNIYGAVKHELSQKGFDALKTDFGFTPSEFVPTVWELIPYSFLVDYFSNVGNALSVASFPTNQLAWSSSTTIHRSKRESNSVFVPRPDVSGGGSQSYSSERKSVSRTVAQTITVPRIRLELPSFSGQYLNLAALFTSAHTTQRQLQRL